MPSTGRAQPRPADEPAAEGGSAAADPGVELFRRARGGDRGAFGSLVTLYQDRIYNTLVRMVGDRDEARELAQETFARGLMKLESFRGESQPQTWLFRIAINLAITRLRKVKRHRTFSLDRPTTAGGAGGDDQAAGLADRVADTDATDPADGLERRERHEQVLAALGRLEPEQRTLLVLRDIEGLDYQQLADLLGLPLGTLKSRLFRARAALAEQLKGYFGS
jgi:RNA polymerase sigma-70 factor (ECF subfamily)